MVEFQDEYCENKNSELHCTLIYSKKPHKNKINSEDYKITAKFKGYEYFGENKDTLVVLLESEELINRNKFLVKEYGFISDFETYTPHVTLSYNSTVDISTLPDIEFDVVLENEYVQDLVLDWSDE